MPPAEFNLQYWLITDSITMRLNTNSPVPLYVDNLAEDGPPHLVVAFCGGTCSWLQQGIGIHPVGGVSTVSRLQSSSLPSPALSGPACPASPPWSMASLLAAAALAWGRHLSTPLALFQGWLVLPHLLQGRLVLVIKGQEPQNYLKEPSGLSPLRFNGFRDSQTGRLICVIGGKLKGYAVSR